jgi:hypothetical protein
MSIGKLWRGDYGLPITYWAFGWLASAVWAIPLSMVTPGSAVAILVGVLLLAWMILVYVGIWNAASKFEGFVLWAFLAKAQVVLPLIGLSIAAVTLGITGAS